MSDAATIGAQLRTARERLGVDIKQAAESLHVDPAVIVALEEGRFFALGAPVFARGYLRHYADFLGEPHEEVAGRYTALQEARRPPDLRDVPLMAGKQVSVSRPRWPLVVLAVALVVAALVWWAMGVKSV